MSRAPSGFTLIELLVVVLVIGVLAAIGVSRFRNAKEKTHVTTMKSDLRNLVTGQETYFSANGTYYGGPVPAAGTAFNSSSGVTITLSDVSANGWAATATHIAVPTKSCAVFVGQAPQTAPATVEGQITCQ